MAGVNKNFVVKNGLEVKSNLLLADSEKNSVGIGTSNINYKLHVRGGIGATDLIVTGVATVPYIHLNGTVAAGASLGVSGQYLARLGTGVTWKDFTTTRTTISYTAAALQTSFVFNYTVGLVDVFVNGVRLSTTEYVAVDGTTVVLNQPCFGGETVDLISYSTISAGYAFTGIYGISVSEEGSYVGTPGGVVSLNFVGSAVTAVGSGAGVTVYITDTGGGGGGESYWASNAAGIHTLSKVGIGTTNPRFALEVGAVGASGTSLYVNGDARITGIVTIGTSSITLNGSSNTINVGSGVTINGSTGVIQATSVNVSGATTALSIGSSAFTLTNNNITIVGTAGTVGEIKRIGGAPFFYDGSAWREFVLSSGTPVSVPADTEWDNVIYRATFDTDFTDAKFSASPVYVGAAATIVGAAVTIGTGAYRNVGVGLSYAYRSEYDFTGSWTIEFWYFQDTNFPAADGDAAQTLVSMASTTNTSGLISLALSRDPYANVRFRWYNNNAGGNPVDLAAESGTTYTNKFLQKWNHIALVREGDNGSLHFYVNGVESSNTINDAVIDNNIINVSGAGLIIGGTKGAIASINSDILNYNDSYVDAIFDDMRISCGVGTAGQRYTSIGISTYATFSPPTTALPTTGTLSSYVQPPGDKYGEIGLGTSPTWRGTSGVTVSQQSSGNYRVSFASTYTNANDYYVLSQGMDQGFASYVGIARSITHVDLSINKQSDDTAVNTGSLAVQIKNHI